MNTVPRRFPMWCAIVVAIAALASWWLGNTMINREPSALVVVDPISDPSLRVDLGNAEEWVRHLSDGGTIRLVRADAVSTGSVEGAQTIEGQGKLDGNDLVFARESLYRLVAKRTKAMERHYAKAPTAWTSEEERQLEEAELALRSRTFDSYLQAFERGSYFLVASSDVKPPTPGDFLGLNVGVTHQGRNVLMVVLARKSQYGLVDAEAEVARVRRQWIEKVAYCFNEKTYEERAAMLKRLDANSQDDKQWRDRNFPEGLRIDKDACILYVLK